MDKKKIKFIDENDCSPIYVNPGWFDLSLILGSGALLLPDRPEDVNKGLTLSNRCINKTGPLD